MQVSVAASDFANFPMDTFTAAPNNRLRGLRWYVAGWAKSGLPATLAAKSNDGTNDIFSVAVADHGFDDTSLIWLCGMQRRKIAAVAAHYLLTQSKMDALTLSIGGSTDANPDVGIHAILAEVAYSPAVAYQISAPEDGTFSLYVKQDPLSGAAASYTVTTPAGTRGATFVVTVDGADQTHHVGPNDLQTFSIGADATANVTGTSFQADPVLP
jgi:hypothetical protein